MTGDGVPKQRPGAEVDHAGEISCERSPGGARVHIALTAARERDAAATGRERAAAARDAAAAAREAETDGNPGVVNSRHATEDRRRAARDRFLAARERHQALEELELLVAQLTGSETDPVTGARARAAGLIDLAAEIARCWRVGVPLAVAYLDVIGLKAVNDTLGHAAGDRLLAQVVGNLRAKLRPYDVIVRLGGDEFLCAMPGLTVPAARARFTEIVSDTVPAPDPRRLRTGFANLQPGDTAAGLIARADAETTGRRRLGLAASPRPRGGTEHRRVGLVALLDAVRDFGTASLELIAWEFQVPEGSLHVLWELSIGEQLITAAGIDTVVGEQMYKLTARGTARLHADSTPKLPSVS